jgi:hypothetical protein
MTKKKAKLPLTKTHPKLAKEAHGWDPTSITAGSGKKVKWKCPKGHIYESVVVSRTGLNTNCPICSGRQVLAGFNDIASLFPKLAKEAFGWSPKEFTPGSNFKKEWKCSKGHRWVAVISQRTRKNGSGCPYCSGLKTLPGFNDLKSSNSKIAKEAFGWDPSTVAPQSNKKKDWKCKKNHVYSASPAERFGGNGCPICSGQKILKGFNDLKTLLPALALEADGWDPSKIGPGSSKKLAWKCNHGHKWKAIVYSRKNGNGCPVCAGKKIVVGFNDLATVNPKLAAEAFGWDPKKVTVSNGKSKKWKCQNGHKWDAPVARRSAGSGCPYCAGQKVQVGFNDLATVNPKLAAEAFGWDPKSTTISSDRIEKWKCPLGHIYVSAVKSRTKGTQCAVCSGQKVQIGFNDLVTTDPVVAKEAFGWDPKTVTRGSTSKKLKWKCPKGHIYETTPHERTREDGKNSGCGVCASKIVLIGYNDLYSIYPEIAMQANGWDPKTVTFASGKMKSWKCHEGHTWNAIVSSRRINGCPTCAPHGFDPNKDSYLYFLDHNRWQMFQIGITNYPDQRLSQHGKLGWEIIEVRGPMDGHLTQQWETAILRMIRSSGADLANKDIAGSFDGFSEAWSKSTFQANSIKELMQLTEEFEEKKSVTNLSYRKTKKDKN